MIKVSVCIPTYNQAKFIAAAVNSAFHQTMPVDEIVVSDDCSTDDTISILENLRNSIPTLKIIRQPVNLGINRNNDAVLRFASGELIVKLDSDDYLAPTYVEKLSALIAKYPEAGYAHAAVQEIDEVGRFTRPRTLARKTGYFSGDKALKAALNGYQVAANIIMFKKEALEKVGFLASTINFAEDYHLSTSLAAQGYGNVYLGEIQSYYRVWSDSGKVRQRRKLDEIIGLRTVFEEVLTPAYAARNWNVKTLENKRMSFACRQSDCLGWDVYSTEEKQELLNELKKLSSHKLARFSAWLYLNNLGGIDIFLNKIKSFPKKVVKQVLIGLPKVLRYKLSK